MGKSSDMGQVMGQWDIWVSDDDPIATLMCSAYVYLACM